MGYRGASFLKKNSQTSSPTNGSYPQGQQDGTHIITIAEKEQQTSDAIVEALLASTPTVKAYDKKVDKRCIKCRIWKKKEGNFGVHDSTTDGYQSICFTCKNNANKKERDKNTVVRIRHHTATRCITQLGSSCPDDLTANLEHYLGYRIKALVDHLREDLKRREGPDRKLRDALNEGYHIDHLRPLRLYDVIMPDGNVNWVVFRHCWAMENLSAIPGIDNLKKGGKFHE